MGGAAVLDIKIDGCSRRPLVSAAKGRWMMISSQTENSASGSAVSISKMSVSELRSYTAQLDDYLQSPNAAAIRICECCIKVSIESPTGA